MNQLIKQLFYFLSLISISLPQTLSSYNYKPSSHRYYETPEVEVTWSASSNNSKKNTKPPDHLRDRSHGRKVAKNKRLDRESAEYFQQRSKNEKPAKIFKRYQDYKVPVFREYIKTLPGFKKHIQKVHKELSGRWWITHRLAKIFVASSPSHVKEHIQQLYDESMQDEQLVNQVPRLYFTYRDGQTSNVKQLPQRMNALNQSLSKLSKEPLQRSLYESNWSDVDHAFIKKFNLASSIFDLNGIPIQNSLQKEFYDIAQKTAKVWKTYGDNAYINKLVEKNVTCIKKGIEHNKEGKIIEAVNFADIAWRILDHIQALGEGVVQGTGNVAHIFLHPIDTAQGIGQAICTITSSLRQATLEVVDLCILHATDQNAADKKLQAWKQNFTKLMDTIHEQCKETENRDITKFIARLTTEVILTKKISHGLGSFFSFSRTKATNLIKEAKNITDSAALATTPEGVIIQANKAVKHAKSMSEAAKGVDGTSKKIIKKSIDIVNRTNKAVLKNGYYEVNGFKFTKFYYNKLWQNGRGAPSLAAKAILENTTKIIPDPAGYSGFFKYFSDKWEMVYNPTTKIVSHIQPIRNRRI